MMTTRGGHGTHNGPSTCVHGKPMNQDNCDACKAHRTGVLPPPKKTAWQLRPGANGSWLVKCRHGHEKVSTGPNREAFALYLWAISHGKVPHGWDNE